MRLLTLLFCLALPFATLAAPPSPYSADYQVLRNGEPLGKATVTFKRLPDGRYELVTHTRGTEGLASLAGVEINERSLLRWQGERPETVEYRFRQEAAWSKRERSVVAEPGARRIVLVNKDQRTEQPYQPGVLDRHALTAAMMQDLAAGLRSMTYTVADRSQIAPQRYAAAANVRLRTALGQLRAIRVERQRDDADGRSTKIWFARERGFVPVRILQQEPDGESIEMRVVAIR